MPADVQRSPDQRIVEAGHALHDLASVTGWAALRWMGALWFDGIAQDGVTQRPVVIAVRHGSVRSQDGIKVTSEFIPPRDRQVVDDLQVTVPVCATAYEARYAPDVRSAVRAIDMAAAADLVSIEEMRQYAELLYHWTGIQMLRDALDLADENVWSPLEVDLLLDWQLAAGFPRPLANRPVFDLQGRFVGTPDLLDPVAGVVGQYDGRLHAVAGRRARDLRTEDAFREVGLEYFTMVAEDRADQARTVRRMRAARARAAFLPPDQRLWTIDPPTWWVPTHTVDLRRSLTPAQRERWLGYRRTA